MVRPPAAGGRGQLLLVGQHFGHRDLGLDRCRGAARLHAADLAAATVEVTHQVAGVVAGRVHLDVHDGLEQRGSRTRHGVAEREPARHLEGHFVRIDLVERSVEEGDPKVHHRVAGQIASCPRLLDALFDGGDEPARDRAPEDLVDELKVLSARQRRHLDLAVPELAMSAGLLLVTSVRLGSRLDGLAIRDSRQLEIHLDPEAALELGDGDLDVQLSLSGEQQLRGLGVAGVADGRVLFLQPLEGGADLLLVSAALRFYGIGQYRLGEPERRESPRGFFRGQRVSRPRFFQLGHRAQVAGSDLGDAGLGLALQEGDAANPFAAAATDIVNRRVRFDRTTRHPEHGDPPCERIRDGLPYQRRRGVGRISGRRVPVRIDHRQRSLRRGREIREDGVEQGLQADVGGGRRAHQGEQMPPRGRGLEPGLQLLLGQGA